MFDRERIEAIKRNRQRWEEEVLHGSPEALHSHNIASIFLMVSRGGLSVINLEFTCG